MERTRVFFWLLSLLFVCYQCISLYSQQTGYKYFTNYTPTDYRLQPQNWSILQDKRGIIYIGNHGGLAEYDGVSWRVIQVPNRTVRALAMDPSGTIYVGGINQIGYAAPDENGKLHYVSLREFIHEQHRNFGNVWKAHSSGEMIYFKTSKLLFRWNYKAKKMQVWETKNLFLRSFVCQGKLFIMVKNVGLMQILGDSLKPVPGGEIFAGKRVTMMVRYDNQQMLIGTYAQGLYLYDGTTLKPFPTGVNKYLKENLLYHGIRLSKSRGDFALATFRGGLVIIDKNGGLKYILNKAHGLQHESVMYMFEDSCGNLWLALSVGISKIEYNSPISTFDNRNGLPGLVLSVVKYGPKSKLYAGTTSGLYLLHPDGKFRLVPGITNICWSLLATGDSVLAATSAGLFEVETRIKRKIINNRSFTLLRSRKDTNRIWVGTGQGLTSIYLSTKGKGKNSQWEKEYHFEHFTDEVRTIVEDQEGNLWLGTLTTGVLEIKFPGDIHHPEVSRYHIDHGLPPGNINAFMVANRIMVGTDLGLFYFDTKKKVFTPDASFGNEFADGSRSVFHLKEDKNKNIWIHSERRNFQATSRSNRTFILNKNPFLRMPAAQVNTIYLEPPGDIAWFASHNGLVRYDTRIKKDYHQPFQAIIRRVIVNGTPVFEGSRYRGDNNSKSKPHFPIIDYKNRNLLFEYAAPFFEDETSTEYSYFLEGYDDDWSHWSEETKKEYTNLDGGSYTFRVKAKNVFENISREDVFQFRVLPPWYQTWWAFLVYAVVFLLIMYLVVKWRSWKLEQEKQRLEQIIKERTKEINNQKQQLQVQAGKLKEMDRVKSRFFANISHEFRTPLTLIMGPLEQVLSDNPDKKQEENINLALRNSQRLLTLINQLLDLSKLDSGKMQLQATRQNVIPFLKGVVGSFESLAVQRKLELTFHTEQENITLYYDAEKLEKVICNLVSNAVKFTPAQGKITVTAANHPTKEEHYLCGFLEIRVCDTGVGIPPDQLPYIFDRFYQAEGVFSHQHKHKGSGIGLALVKELVELHHGDISVQSSEGKGTEFTIHLPLGADHLKPGEIKDADESPPAAQKTDKVPEHDTVEYVETEQEIANKREDEGEIGSEDVDENVILVVEDNPEVRKYIRDPLEAHYKVVEAADGSEGIDKARKIIPDLIVSDIMMPNADGYELCNVLKKDVKTSHIPIVLLTAKGSEENIIEGLETGADDYITKPFNTKILLTRIKNLIDLRRGLQEKIQREMILQPAEIAVSSIDREFMKELKEAIEKNMSEPEFGVDELAKALYMGRATLNRKVRALSGESINHFIQSFRLKRAAQLLKANFGNITEVAFEVGFSSSAYFTKCFKDKFHQLPHQYQAAHSGSS